MAPVARRRGPRYRARERMAGDVSRDLPRPAGRRRAALAALLTALGATASCRQIAGLQAMPKPCGDPLMIDDMEDGNPQICASQGRNGSWYSFGDGTSGTQMLAPNATIPGGRGSSRKAAHFTGSGFSKWGAMAAFDFKDQVGGGQGLGRDVYKASNAGGLTFWMKSSTPVIIQLQMPATLTVAEGGNCAAGVSASNCDNAFSFVITAPDSDWTQHKVPFTALKQLYPGTATWDPSQLLNVQFLVGPGATFDVWIDDVAFYYCAETECAPTCTDPALPVSCPKSTRYPAGCFPTGTDCAVIDTWCSDPMLIDDMEDGDNWICPSGGRMGIWWTTSDGTSNDYTPPTNSTFTQTPIPGGRGTSHAAARLAGSGFTGWGALMAFNLVGSPAAGQWQTYDASAADGISFWMKTNTFGADFEIHTPDTIAVSDGGSCVDSATAVNCNRSWSYWVNAPAPDTWFQVAVPFAALTQGWGVSQTTANLIPGSATWDPTKLVKVQFATPGLAPFELWIDDVRFYTCGGSACVPTCTDPNFTVACPAGSGQPAGCWPAGTDCSNRQPRPDINTGVWGSAANDVWVVGLSSGAAFQGIVFHWDGAAWTRFDVGTVPWLGTLAGVGRNAVWAVGDHGTALRWNGSNWLSTDPPTDASLNNVWISDPTDDVWIAAYPGTLYRWNGSAWSQEFSSAKAIYGFWGSAPNDIWAVGDIILHYDGSNWSPVTSPANVSLNRVWGSAPNLWAVGTSIVHYDGMNWTASPNPTSGVLLGVWGSGPNDIWAVGQGGSIVHSSDGLNWSAADSPSNADLFNVWGSSASDVWAVGANHTVLHYDGHMWSPVALVGETP